MMRPVSTVLILALALPLAGCFEDIVKVYDGPPVAEFEQYMQPNAPRTTNTDYTSTVTYAASNTTGVTLLPLKVNLIANINGTGQFPRDTFIGFRAAEQRVNQVYNTETRQWEMQPQANWTTTAIEGVHYRFVTPNGRAVFPANTSTTELKVETIAANLAPGESRTLVLELTDGDEIAPSENYKWYRIIIRKAAQ